MIWGKKAKRRQKMQEETAAIIRQAEEMTSEMNLRLLLEQESGEDILFVESITAVEIFYPPEEKAMEVLKKTLRKFSAILSRTVKAFLEKIGHGGKKTSGK